MRLPFQTDAVNILSLAARTRQRADSTHVPASFFSPSKRGQTAPGHSTLRQRATSEMNRISTAPLLRVGLRETGGGCSPAPCRARQTDPSAHPDARKLAPSPCMGLRILCFGPICRRCPLPHHGRATGMVNKGRALRLRSPSAPRLFPSRRPRGITLHLRDHAFEQHGVILAPQQARGGGAFFPIGCFRGLRRRYRADAGLRPEFQFECSKCLPVSA